MGLQAKHVEEARLRAYEGSQETRADADVLCTSLDHLIPWLEELRDDLVDAAAAAHWLPSWIARGLVRTAVELLIDGLWRWRDAECAPPSPES